MPLNALEIAFDETLAAAAEVKGAVEKVNFRGSDLNALIDTDVTDLVPVGGGYADATMVKVSVRTREVVLPINILEPITVRGEDLAVMNYAALEGRIDIVAYDPASDNSGT